MFFQDQQNMLIHECLTWQNHGDPQEHISPFVFCHSYYLIFSATVSNPPADVLMHDLDLGWTLTGSGNYNLSLQDLKVMMMIT